MRFVFLASLLIFAEIALADFDHAMELYGKNDYENAFLEFESLAKNGSHSAQFNLGVMYYKGQSVVQDVIKGYAWMALASQAGDEQWSGMRDRIYREFTDEQKKQADRQRREIYDKYADGALTDQDAIVILGGMGYGYLDNLVFAMIDSDYQFSIKFDVVGSAPELYIRHVKPGRYYLRNLGVNYTNVLNSPKEQPRDINETILIPANSVTYIGDWTAIERHTNDIQYPQRYDVNIEYSKDILVKAATLEPTLQKFPLFLSKAGVALVPLAWY